MADPSGLTIALVGGAFTTLGVALKVGYDAIAQRASRAAANAARFAPERRATYERFLAALQDERAYWRRLHDLSAVARRGESVPDSTLEDFPPSPMKELTSALEEVRRIAGSQLAIESAENIVRLFVDMASASRRALQSPSTDDDLVWFLLQRFQEDREREFVHAYREDLGLGPPRGGPRRYPIQERPWPLADAEGVVRNLLRGETLGPRAGESESGDAAGRSGPSV